MRVPNMIAESTSRPWSSVPSKYPALLPVMPAAEQSVEEVQRPEIERVVRRDPGAKSAPQTQARTIAETMATGE
jgi:hypothetical protein